MCCFFLPVLWIFILFKQTQKMVITIQYSLTMVCYYKSHIYYRWKYNIPSWSHHLSPLHSTQLVWFLFVCYWWEQATCTLKDSPLNKDVHGGRASWGWWPDFFAYFEISGKLNIRQKKGDTETTVQQKVTDEKKNQTQLWMERTLWYRIRHPGTKPKMLSDHPMRYLKGNHIGHLNFNLQVIRIHSQLQPWWWYLHNDYFLNITLKFPIDVVHRVTVFEKHDVAYEPARLPEMQWQASYIYLSWLLFYLCSKGLI